MFENLWKIAHIAYGLKKVSYQQILIFENSIV